MDFTFSKRSVSTLAYTVSELLKEFAGVGIICVGLVIQTAFNAANITSTN